MKYWLMKSEPGTFGITDLDRLPEKTDHWDGIRNYQARNFMRDQMHIGDKAFFYHSNCPEPGIVGTMEVVREAYPDFTALDPDSHYFDPKSSPENNRWCMVDMQLRDIFPRTLTLVELRQHAPLGEMILLRKGNRLSIMPVTVGEWEYIIGLL